MRRFYENTPLEEPCFEHFVNWYEDTYKNMHVFMVTYWDELPFTMQFGVYEEFFQEKGIEISLERFKTTETYEPVVNCVISQNPMPWHLAKVELIREAGEEYNKKHG